MPKEKPYFTVKKKEWEALGPKGQKALAELAKAVAEAFKKGQIKG